MLVSYNWLKQYVKIPESITPEELGLKLTMSTVEIEEVIDKSKSLDGVVVGEILEIKKHPDADKLSVSKVDVGEKNPRQIIFGQMAKMEIGFKVPVALAPTVLPLGQKIKKAKLRGELSEGMLCLDQELGFLDEGTSIQFFDKKLKNGTPIVEAMGLDDIVFDIDNKSMTHRPDLWGHYGLAREVSALYDKDLKEYKTEKIKTGNDIKIKVDIEDTKLCPRYMAVELGGIKVKSSPDWLQKKLLAVGLRPINNIVDITNYILYDLGQPMHAFDAKNLDCKDKDKKKIIVRRAKAQEKFITLDEVEHELSNEDLVITDEKKVVALAGVMGGLNSEINEETKTIVFESANFDAVSVRKTATRLGMRTDSSARFEKSLDPMNAQIALNRAVELTLELCPEAKVISNVVDESSFSISHGPLELSLDFLNRKMGIEVEKKQVIKILESLGFEVKDKKDRLLVVIPSWRATKDISIPDDLVEEVSRIYGYDNIEYNLPVFPIIPPIENNLKKLQRKVLSRAVLGEGYSEVYNYSFVNPKQIENLGDKLKSYIELDNPISKEKPYLRRNLLLNMLENIEKNIEFFPEVKIVEIGKVFLAEEPGEKTEKNSDTLLPRQDTYFGALYASKKDKNPFWEVKRVVEVLSENLGVDIKFETASDIPSWAHPGRAVRLFSDKLDLGLVYQLHPQIKNNFGLEVEVGVLEINLNNLLAITRDLSLKYKSLSEYPEVIRDIAFVVKKEIKNSQVKESVFKIDEKLKSFELFDIYEGKNLGEGYKSMAYHLKFGSDEKTLTAEEVDEVMKKIVKKLEKELKAEVRK